MLSNMIRAIALLSAGVLAILVTSCGGGVSLGYYDHRPIERTHVYVEPEPVHVTRIQVDHVCSERCYDHYYNGSNVVVLSGHRHGPDCGHRWNGRYWVRVIAKRRPIHREQVDVHVCSEHCYGHYYDGSRIVVLNGHHHGRNCGHRWDGRHWVISKGASYRRSNDAHRNASQSGKLKSKGHYEGMKRKKSKGS